MSEDDTGIGEKRFYELGEQMFAAKLQIADMEAPSDEQQNFLKQYVAYQAVLEETSALGLEWEAGREAAYEAWRKNGRKGGFVFPLSEELNERAKVLQRERIAAENAFRSLHLEILAPPSSSTAAAARVQPLARTQELPAFLLHASDNLHGAAIRAFSALAQWHEGQPDFARAWSRDFDNLQITIGLPDGSTADSLWQFLSKGGARMVKAHYALWARWYDSGGGDSTGRVTVNINQFCADLGYVRHHNGGYRLENKQEALKLLEGLTSVEMRALWFAPGEKPGVGKQRRLRGPLWSRGHLTEERDGYGDLFGQAKEGDPKEWEPMAFSYAPGPWFDQNEWRKYNHAVGKIGSGLMQLDSRKDEWAVLIGGYLGTQFRVNHYDMQPLHVETILRETNLAQTADARRRSAQYRDKFERAMERLIDVKVIASWTWDSMKTAELFDTDDPAAVGAYYAEDALPKGVDWRKQKVKIILPEEFKADNERLEAAQKKAVSRARRRSLTTRQSQQQQPREATEAAD